MIWAMRIRAHHKLVPGGPRAAGQVGELVHVSGQLAPVIYPIRGVEVRAGLVLDEQGVTEVGYDVDALSQEDSAGGVPVIHL